MVTRDYNNEIPKLPRGARSPRPMDFNLAQPIDRFAAVVIDTFMVLMPVLMLLCAPFRKELSGAVLLNDDFGFTVAIVSISILVFVTFVLYNAIMIHYWGATIGKLFFDIRVVQLWTGERPRFWAATMRSVVWFLETLPLAVPHLSVMSNVQRRPLHDRVADTVVISLKEKRAVGSPTFMEVSFSKGVFVAFITFWSLVFIVSASQMYMSYKSQAYLVPMWEEEGQLCGAVGKARSEWPEDVGERPNRLSVAMALFAAGELDKSCLQAEVQLVEEQGALDTLYYLSQSFVNAEDSELSNRYLEQVCDMDSKSDNCAMSRIIELWAERDWDAVDKVFRSVKDPNQVYISIWAIRQYLKNSQFGEAQKVVNRIPSIPAVSNFLSQQRAKIYWGLKDYDKSKVAAEVAYDSLDTINRIDLSSWMCYEQAALGCQSMKSKSCEVFKSEILHQPTLLADGKIAMTFIKQHECKKAVNYKRLANAFKTTDFKGFVTALDLFEGKKYKESQEILKDLMNNESLDASVREEARRRLIGQAQSYKEIKPYLSEWKENLGGLEWEKTGHVLFRRLNKLKKHKESLIVGENLVPFAKNNKNLQQDLVKSAVEVGESFAAWKMLRSLQKSQDRAPASEGDFDKIKQDLIKEFGEL